jgi:nucleotide-binding universal stress UspA family protein
VTSSRRRIVVAVDSSRGARVGLEHATRRAGPDGELIVAHVPDAVAKAMLTDRVVVATPADAASAREAP